ncbi:MAG: hypothetical protein R2705_09770 [Ilumatobacteraceae bacterium]
MDLCLRPAKGAGQDGPTGLGDVPEVFLQRMERRQQAAGHGGVLCREVSDETIGSPMIIRA